MKKIILILILLLSTSLFSYSETEKLMDDISGFIVENYKILENNGYGYDGIYWTSVNSSYPGSVTRYTFDLEKGIEYIIYTMTTGQVISVSIKAFNQTFYCSKPGSRFITMFVAPRTGDYHYYVNSISDSGGYHVSYLIKIWRKNVYRKI